LLGALERYIGKTAHSHDPVSLARLHTIPGVGKILALMLLYEIEDIARFPRVQACVSDARLVKSARESHGKRHGTSGRKIGNAHLKWAFSEAAVRLLKHHEPAQKSLAKRATQHGTGKALSILAHTRGRAVYCMLKQHVAFDQATFLAA
jgi:transposase